MRKITLTITQELCQQLGITDSADESAVGAAIVASAKKAAKADAIQAQLDSEKQGHATAKAELERIKTERAKAEITDMLGKALEDKKISVETSTQFEKDYANNPEGLKAVLKGMGAYRSVVDQIEARNKEAEAQYAGKSWDELYEANLLPEIKANHPALYKQLYEKEHGTAGK